MSIKEFLKKAGRITLVVLPYVLITIGVALILTSIYKNKNFGTSQIEEMIFYIFNGATEGQTGMFVTAAWQNALYTALITLGISLLLVDFWRKWLLKKIPKRRKFARRAFKPLRLRWKYLVAALIFGWALYFTSQSFGLVPYVKSMIEKSVLFDENYVDPKTAELTFPEKKRNLIYIYMESMENTVGSRKNGGMSEQSLIPELEAMAMDENNVSFSHTNSRLGGAVQAHGTSWTVAGLTAQSAGVPLKTKLLEGQNGNSMDNYRLFLPGAHSLGDVLKSQGYNQTLMIGSNASFGGRDKLFSQHGDYKIFDLQTARDTGKIPDDYQVWWGYEDSKLISYAKEELTNLGKKSEPFNFQMLTVDTHFPDGYLDGSCPRPLSAQYDNVHRCAAKMVSDFVSWVKKQPFYENTTIIISGDHLGMQTEYYDNLKKDSPGYERTIFSVIINPAIQPKNELNRRFTSFDMYPTTLAALGVKIKGERLALGTNLFSSRSTLLEDVGSLQTYNDELAKRSRTYEKTIMLGK